MRTLLCVTILFTMIIRVVAPRHVDASRVAFTHPASASDLRHFYRAIQALSADSWIDGSALAMV